MNVNPNLRTALLFVVIVLSGFWLSRSGKPYNGLVLTIHKLISLAAVVLFVTTMVQSNRAGALSAPALIAGVVTGLFFLSLIGTGGLLSSKLQTPAVVSKLHQVAPYLTMLSTAATLYVLSGR